MQKHQKADSCVLLCTFTEHFPISAKTSKQKKGINGATKGRL